MVHPGEGTGGDEGGVTVVAMTGLLSRKRNCNGVGPAMKALQARYSAWRGCLPAELPTGIKEM